jgi:hypothetical protein
MTKVIAIFMMTPYEYDYCRAGRVAVSPIGINIAINNRLLQ